MLKKHELLDVIKSALNDMPDISDKPNHDGSYSIFEKNVTRDINGDLIFTFTESYNGNTIKDVYKISVDMIAETCDYKGRK